MRSYSQVGQDLWVADKLPNKDVWPGPCRVFLDIGCAHPFERSNTAMLEEVGWCGWGIDNGADLALWKKERPNMTVVLADATTFDYRVLTTGVDYLSIDVDSASLAALQRFVEHGLTFKVATIEHDAYRFGPAARDEMRRLLKLAGYTLERADVEDMGMAFEDWWVR